MKALGTQLDGSTSPHPGLSIRDHTGTGAPLDVLVLDAENRQALASVRTYGRAGLRPGAVACAAEAAGAATFRSRWCQVSAVVPDITSDASAYADALLALLAQYPTRMLLPGHDGSIEAIRARRGEFERVTALPLGSEAALDIAVSKVRTLALAQSLGIAVPRSVTVTDLAEVPAALSEVGLPAVVKPAQSWVERDGVGVRLGPSVPLTAAATHAAVALILKLGGQVVLQQWLPGRREAVSVLYAQERFWARFAQASYREFPPLGGVSVLCESIPLLPDIVEPSERLIRAVGLEGCSMVEFRRDAAGKPVLMEINPRIGGSVALAINAGVDFPRLVYAWALGEPLTEVTGYRAGKRLRWVAGDVWNLKWAFDAQREPDAPPPWRAVSTFLADFVVRPSAIDYIEMGDWAPAFVDMRKTVWHPLMGRMRKAPVARMFARSRKAV